jgi:Spx/MgsR family transcriptional regulator
MLKVYEYPACSTCKKALKFLDRHGVPYERIDITETPPSKAALQQMLAHVGGDVKKLFNTSGLVYKEMQLSKKLPTMALGEALSLLAGNGRLIKRPFVLAGKHGVVGFKEEAWSALVP